MPARGKLRVKIAVSLESFMENSYIIKIHKILTASSWGSVWTGLKKTTYEQEENFSPFSFQLLQAPKNGPRAKHVRLCHNVHAWGICFSCASG